MSGVLKVLAVTFLLAAVALAGVAWHLNGQQKHAPGAAAAAPARTFPAVVATRSVSAGQQLAAADLKIELLPAALAGAKTNVAQLVGQRAALDIGEGTPVLDGMTSGGLALKIPTGHRAVAVRVEESTAVGHRVRPGDLVDVFLTLKPDGREVDGTQARLLVPLIRVLGYGADSVDLPATQQEGSRDSQARHEPARTAVLSVPLAQVNTLLLGEGAGRLALALRHPDDNEQPVAALVTAATAMPVLASAKGEVPSASDRAAFGTRLAAIQAGAVGSSSLAARPLPAPTSGRPVRTAVPSRTDAAREARVEIIRPSGREYVAY